MEFGSQQILILIVGCLVDVQGLSRRNVRRAVNQRLNGVGIRMRHDRTGVGVVPDRILSRLRELQVAQIVLLLDTCFVVRIAVVQHAQHVLIQVGAGACALGELAERGG